MSIGWVWEREAVDSLKQLGSLDVRAMPQVLGRLTKLAWRYPLLSTCAVICALGTAIFNLITPRLLGKAVDQAHHLLANSAVRPEMVRDALFTSALLIVGASVVRGVMTGLQGYLGENIAQRVGYDLRLAFFEKLQHLNFGYHDVSHSGDLIARGMLDLEGVRAFLESGVLRVITLALLLGIGSWRLIHTDLLLGVLALSFVPFVLWRATHMGILLRLSWQRLQQLMSELTLGMEENLQGVRVVRAFAARAHELAKFDKVAQAALRISNQRITVRMSSMSTMHFAYYVSLGLVLLVGGYHVKQGLMTVGTLTEFLTFMTILQQPVRQVGMIVNSSARAASAGSRLFEVLDAQPEIHDAPDAQPLQVKSGVLRFESVDFSYDVKSDKKNLSDISFEVGAGKILGIVGPPGSGKSTLAHLIPRFYDVTSGRITIDGQDIRQVTLESLRNAVSLVQQEVFLFDTSVYDNVAYAEPWAEEAQVIEAARIAQIHDHVAGLPQGYDTRVGERGVALSGGQRQRMSIARGLVADPVIMILDDSTAAIDAVTERHLLAALRGAVKQRATIIIAHRLHSLQNADEIIVLDQGRIVERGAHRELLSMHGVYAALWELQNHPDEKTATLTQAKTSSGLREVLV